MGLPPARQPRRARLANRSPAPATRPPLQPRPSGRGPTPELFAEDKPLSFRLAGQPGKPYPRARICLRQTEGGEWEHDYDAATNVAGRSGPFVGPFPTPTRPPSSTGCARLSIIRVRRAISAPASDGIGKTNSTYATKILKWADELAESAHDRLPDEPPAADPRATLETARSDALKRLVDPAFARREKALAEVEQRLKIAQAAATTPPENLLHGSRQVLHRELWEEPQATAEFLALMLEALKA